MKKGWGRLGVVDTIHEEEHEHDHDHEYSSSSSPPLSPSPSSPSATLHSRIQAWSLAKGRKPDVLIHVETTCFRLHKDPLTSRSTYLKRQLTDLSDLTLSPPLNITAQTFSLVVDFCYGDRIAMTPYNVAALRTAAELLQMTESNGDGGENLQQITEAYFRRIVTVNREYALIVFHSCLGLLPQSETTSFLVSKCIEAVSLTDEGFGVVNFFDEIVALGAEDFKIVAESMNLRFTCHDVIYEIADLYIKVREHSGEITEELRAQICSSIDCNKLSSHFRLHAVQNPRMPLRFIVRAMLAEQLNTRRSIFSAANQHSQLSHNHTIREDPITLGAILQRDAALREAAQLKAAAEATSMRIQSLEKEVSGMKKMLNETEKERSELIDVNNRLLHAHEKGRSVLDSGRSASFHYGKGNKIERGERGSVSSLNMRFSGKGERAVLASSSSDESPRIKKSIGKRLINGLKSAFRVSKHGSNKQTLSRDEDAKMGNSRHGSDEEEAEDYFMVIRDVLSGYVH